MKRTTALILLVSALALLSRPGLPASGKARAQEAETDPLVLAKLAQWQDWKFGLMMHWGPYSQWGVVESWTLCSEDEPWRRRSMPNYVEYKKAYEALPRRLGLQAENGRRGERNRIMTAGRQAAPLASAS